MNETLINEITMRVVEAVESLQATGADVPIGVSARHVHLCKEHMDVLFGEGSRLTLKKELMGGQFAAQQTLTVVGGKLKAIEKVRVLGPLRAKTQVEVSRTDSIYLGVPAPVRDSGDLFGSAAVVLVGPCGAVSLHAGCIVPRRHIHMSPADAARYGLHDKQIVDVRATGERGGVFANVLVRVDESYTLEMHIDTDEANAFGTVTGDKAMVRSVE